MITSFKAGFLVLDIDEKLFSSLLLKEIATQMNKALTSLQNDPSFKDKIGEVIEDALKSQPEWASLQNGDLRKILGIQDSSPALNSIVKALKDSIFIKVDPVKSSSNFISGGLIVALSKKDMSDVLSADNTSYQSKGGNVPWLNWLLTAGDSIIIDNYSVKRNVFTSASRTGDTIMIHSNKGFRIPPEYSGTIDDNWITRGLSGLEDIIGNIINIEFTKRLK